MLQTHQPSKENSEIKNKLECLVYKEVPEREIIWS